MQVALIDADPLFYKLALGAKDRETYPDHFIKNDLESMFSTVMKDANCTQYRAFMTHKNYRFGFASLKLYKGQRKEKPSYLPKVREIGEGLCSNLGLEIESMIEADDKIGIAAGMLREKGIPYVVCTIDKDLNQIQGQHYTWSITKRDKTKTTPKWYTVQEFDGLKYLYEQCLTGDTVDNIGGLKGVGKVSAQKILEGCSTEVQLWERCLETYTEKGSSLANLLENLHLVYILQKPYFYRPPV